MVVPEEISMLQRAFNEFESPEKSEFCKFLKSKQHIERIEILKRPLLDGGKTAVHAALHYTRDDLLLHFMSYIEDLDELFSILEMQDLGGFTALHYVAHQCNPSLLEHINNGYTIDPHRWKKLLEMHNRVGDTALHIAASSSFPIETVSLMLTALSSNQRAKMLMMITADYAKETVINTIVTCHDVDTIQRLLALVVNKTDVTELLNQQNANDGSTVLHSVDHEEKIKLLLDALDPGERFDLIQMQDIEGKTVLHRAVNALNYQVIDTVKRSIPSERWYELLEIEDNSDCTPVQCIARSTNKKVLRSLLFGVSTKTCFDLLKAPLPSGDNKTLLHCAALSNDVETIEYTLSCLNSVHQIILLNTLTSENKDGFQMSPLDVAIVSGGLQTQETLLRGRESALMSNNNSTQRPEEHSPHLIGQLEALRSKVLDLEVKSQTLSDKLSEANQKNVLLTANQSAIIEIENPLRTDKKDEQGWKERIKDAYPESEDTYRGTEDAYPGSGGKQRQHTDTLFDDTDKVEDVNITRDESCIEEGKKTEIKREDKPKEQKATADTCNTPFANGAALARDNNSESSDFESDLSGDDDYCVIPSDLINSIKVLCENHSIQDCRVLQHPYHWQNITVSATNASTEIAAPLRILLDQNPQYAKFNVTTFDRKKERHTEQLHNWQRTLTFDRETKTKGHAICELIVESGSNPRNAYVVGPAHMLFCAEANEKFKSRRCDITSIRNDIRQTPRRRAVTIQSAHSVEVEVEQTPLIGYRYDYQQPPPDDKSHKLYTNDCVLFQFDSNKAQEVQRDLKDSNLLRDNTLKPVNNKNELQHIHTTRRRVAVQDHRGRLFHSVDIDQDINDCKGVHLTFVLDADENGNPPVLREGASGSIVYHIAKKSDGRERHQPWGMLIGVMYVEELNIDVYQAVVLNQVFKDMQEDYQIDEIQLFQSP